MECRGDGDTIDDYDASTVINRFCANKADTTSVAAVVNSGGYICFKLYTWHIYFLFLKNDLFGKFQFFIYFHNLLP